jgi:putative Mn2+ efflux pump MntP
MTWLELFFIAVGLSMDAFAVALCKGLVMDRIRVKDGVLVALFFGGFQALMPLLGFFLADRFAGKIEAFDHWIAFVLLAIIGGNMIRESLSKDDEDECSDCNCSLAVGAMFVLAIATSIDALAVGVTLALLEVNILAVVLSIGLCTFIISAVGVKVGNVFGAKFKSKAEFLGGAVLVLMGIKILLEHLGVISF